MQDAPRRDGSVDSTNRGETPETCAHAGCGCAPRGDHSPYCGAYCANAERDAPPQDACACEHAACAEEQRVPAGGSEAVTGLGPDPAT